MNELCLHKVLNQIIGKLNFMALGRIFYDNKWQKKVNSEMNKTHQLNPNKFLLLLLSPENFFFFYFCVKWNCLRFFFWFNSKAGGELKLWKNQLIFYFICTNKDRCANKWHMCVCVSVIAIYFSIALRFFWFEINNCSIYFWKKETKQNKKPPK